VAAAGNIPNFSMLALFRDLLQVLSKKNGMYDGRSSSPRAAVGIQVLSPTTFLWQPSLGDFQLSFALSSFSESRVVRIKNKIKKLKSESDNKDSEYVMWPRRKI